MPKMIRNDKEAKGFYCLYSFHLLMSLINLTEEYVKKYNPPFYERIGMAFGLDFYWASSLSAIEEHFRESPPKRKNRLSSQLSAYVVINGLEIKRMYPDSFEEEDGVSLRGFDSGLCFPLFEIRDKTMTRLAYWMAGNSSEYTTAQEEFGFNRESYVPIPKIVLQYRQEYERGWLAIKSLDSDRKPRTERRNLKDKILEFVPEFTIPIPQPGY